MFYQKVRNYIITHIGNVYIIGVFIISFQNERNLISMSYVTETQFI